MVDMSEMLFAAIGCISAAIAVKITPEDKGHILARVCIVILAMAIIGGLLNSTLPPNIAYWTARIEFAGVIFVSGCFFGEV